MIWHTVFATFVNFKTGWERLSRQQRRKDARIPAMKKTPIITNTAILMFNKQMYIASISWELESHDIVQSKNIVNCRDEVKFCVHFNHTDASKRHAFGVKAILYFQSYMDVDTSTVEETGRSEATKANVAWDATKRQLSFSVNMHKNTISNSKSFNHFDFPLTENISPTKDINLLLAPIKLLFM